MAENKTKPTAVSPAAFIRRVTTDERRKDCDELVATMRKATGEAPKMWGPTIVGFGTRHYVYESGREGDICLIGFSPRKPDLVLYLGECDRRLLSKLGKFKTRGGCLYIRKLDDIDRDVLRQLVARSVEEMRKRDA